MRRRWIAVWVALLLVAGTVLGQPSSADPQPYYSEVPLYIGHARAFNDHRQVVGTRRTPATDFHAFLWEDGTLTDIGDAFGVTTWSIAIDVNNRGQVIGIVSASSGKSYMWRDGTVTDLDTLADGYFEPRAINDWGQVVGSAWRTDGRPHTFLWQRGRFTDLGVFEAADVNNRGEVVGSTAAPGVPPHAVLWSNGVLRQLNVPGVSSYPSEINDRGEILGMYEDELGNDQPFLWRRGSITELGFTATGGLNNRGQVIGSGTIADGTTHPFLWERGRMIDLTTRGVTPFVADLDINNRGDLLVNGSVLYLRN